MILKRIEKGNLALESIKKASENGYGENLKTLSKLISENKNTVFGTKHNFSNIKSYSDYIKNVPLYTYNDYEKYIERIENGEKKVLSSRDIIHFATSSGSQGKPKKVPMVQEASDLFALYTHAAAFAVMYKERPWKISRGVSFTEVRFAAKENGFTYGAVSGKVREKYKDFEHLVYTTPKCISYPESEMDFHYLHLRFAVAEKNLSFITCTFISSVFSMMKYLEKNWHIITDDIENGTINNSINIPENIRNEISSLLRPDKKRAGELRHEFSQGFYNIMPRIWKNLSFIFGISGGSFQMYCSKLRRYSGNVRIHFSVYSASEGIFAFPLESESQSMVLIPFSAFYEFMDVNTNEIVTMDKVKIGKEYELIITNLSGFYRYKMGDVIKITDFYGTLPMIRFMYRRSQVLSLCGEKTTEDCMNEVFKSLVSENGIDITDYTLAADTEAFPQRYIVFIESSTEMPVLKIRDIIEDKLCMFNFSYAEKIKNGKLGKLEVCMLSPGTYIRYKNLVAKKGASPNQIKPLRVADTEEKKKFLMSNII
ncbi:MAG: GH3 auxin-responsive promoter family protein [Clostridia bacterium]|jgi:hypothetical protein|nr:GH3 auxin-responsive promoter family protein [Clostridia bacterium]